MDYRETILVFSHLRWDFVYQRPQHLLSRLAHKRRVVFIEEPIYDPHGAAHWEYQHPTANVLVCRPHTQEPSGGFSDEQLPQLQPLLADLLQTEAIYEPIVWLYTPMALPLAQTVTPSAVVFDCMDELTSFRYAPPVLVEREAALLAWADVVFTGGQSLYRAKQGRHPNLHCFPSSVDAAHFRQVRDGLAEQHHQAALPHPRLGFFGVIDERMDLDLIDALARAHSDWQIVMVGPVVKIDPNSLPQHANLHYFGQQAYSDLPSFLAGWDVALLPFALNDATRFISPTKTLEYMAAELPIVSTPITDVAEPYGEIVYLGANHESFIAACERALNAPAAERNERIAAMRTVLTRTSWDSTAQAMEQQIEQILQHRVTSS